MRTFSEQRQLHHSADGLFEIIADVNRYAEFLPWCVASRIRERKADGTLIADLSIGYGSLRETFTSRVTLNSDKSRVTTIQDSGPFRHLKSEWRLAPVSDSETLVNFEIEFEFRSFLLEKVMGAVFESAAHKMIAAFETRADSLLKR